jgi:hypothetical protein
MQETMDLLHSIRILADRRGVFRPDAYFFVLEALENAMENLKLSARALHRTLRVARTIADLDGVNTLNNEHIGEALGYRNPEFKQ